MRIAVMGAGGIGAYVGARLAAAGAEVAFIARGAQLAAMRADGLTIRSALGDLALPSILATDNPAEIGPVDLIVFAVKLWDTQAAADAIAPLPAIGGTLLMSQTWANTSRIVRSSSVTPGIGGSGYCAA